MQNPYTIVINSLGLTRESQGDHAWLYLLLRHKEAEFAADPPEWDGIFAAAYVLDAIGSIDAPFAVTRAKKILNTMNEREQRGQLPH